MTTVPFAIRATRHEPHTGNIHQALSNEAGPSRRSTHLSYPVTSPTPEQFSSSTLRKPLLPPPSPYRRLPPRQQRIRRRLPRGPIAHHPPTQRAVAACKVSIAIPRLIPHHAQERRIPLDERPHGLRVRLLLRDLRRRVRARVLDAEAAQLGLASEGPGVVRAVGLRVAVQLCEGTVEPAEGGGDAGGAVDVHGRHGIDVGGEAHDGQKLRRVLREEGGGDDGAEVADRAAGGGQRGLACGLGAVDETLFPLDVLAVAVETVAHRRGREASRADGGVAGFDFAFVVARELRVRGHVAGGNVPTQLQLDRCGACFAVVVTTDVAGGVFSHEEAVGAFIFEQNNIGHELCVQKRLQLAFGLVLHRHEHLLVIVALPGRGNGKALVDGELEAHPFSCSPLRCLNLDIDAAEIELEKQFLPEEVAASGKCCGAETLASLGLYTNTIDTGVAEGFDGIFHSHPVKVVEDAARNSFGA